MNTRTLTLIALTALLAGCSDDPAGPNGFATEELTTELVVTPGHFHIWETTGMFAVSVTDPDGGAVTDFDLIQVERRLVGGTDWVTVDLTENAGIYTGSYVFSTSGDYELRVMGLRPSDSEMKLLYAEPTALEVVRAHGSAGGYTVRFESFPGHMHQHDTPTFVWWFEGGEAHGNPPAGHPPEEAPTMFVVCPGGTVTSTLTDVGDGEWSADVELDYLGDCDAQVHYVGTDEAQHTYSVPIEISEAHP